MEDQNQIQWGVKVMERAAKYQEELGSLEESQSGEGRTLYQRLSGEYYITGIRMVGYSSPSGSMLAIPSLLRSKHVGLEAVQSLRRGLYVHQGHETP